MPITTNFRSAHELFQILKDDWQLQWGRQNGLLDE